MKLPKVLSGILVIGALLLACPHATYAGASGVSFSDEEIASNRANATAISETAASCISRTWDEHLRFYKQRGYSTPSNLRIATTGAFSLKFSLK